MIHDSGPSETFLNATSIVHLRVGNNDRVWCDGTNNYHNVPGGGSHVLRYNGTDKLTVGATQTRNQQQTFIIDPMTGGGAWNYAPLILGNGSYDGTRLAINSVGVAPQLRAVQANGDALECINNPNSAYSNFRGSAFNVVSSLAFKHDVATFGRERERITVQDWESDVVPSDLTIMDLRPVKFRHNEPAYQANEDGTSTPKDGSTIIGRQRLREHLGLIAQEVAEVIPSAVDFDDNGENPAIDYAQVVVAMLEHMQRLTDEVATLRYRIAELESR
jgi:hypothetical protein